MLLELLDVPQTEMPSDMFKMPSGESATNRELPQDSAAFGISQGVLESAFSFPFGSVMYLPTIGIFEAHTGATMGRIMMTSVQKSNNATVVARMETKLQVNVKVKLTSIENRNLKPKTRPLQNRRSITRKKSMTKTRMTRGVVQIR